MARYALVMCLLLASTGSALQAAQSGPSPDMRALLDGIVAAINGSSDAWESFAQERFAPGLLQQQSPEDRARLHQRLVNDFGSVALGGVERRGPDAPVSLRIKGTKESGVIVLDLASGSPTRIAAMAVTLGDAPRDLGGVPPPPIDGKLTAAEIDRRLDGYFTALAADEVFSGVALVARNGEPVFFKAYGYADREKKIPNTIRTRFNLGSINKAFTQIAIRQLIQSGRLAAADTLGKFFTDYPQAVSRAATVEQLLTHRGGLADFFGPDFDRAPKSQFASNADYFKYVSSKPPLFSPGERNQYCNGCYIALGAIVEKVSGMPYETYVADNVFAPAGMKSTAYPRSDRPEPDIALGYTRRAPSPKPQVPSPRSNIDMHGVTGSAAGGGYSTALDLLAFVKAVRAGTFPGADKGMAIAGGAPGVSAVVESRGEWVVIVLSNFDPPTGERLGGAIADALAR